MKYILMMNGTKSDFEGYARWSKEDLQTNVAFMRGFSKELKDAGGEGAVIALDAKGNFTSPFNSEGLYRGHIDRQGKAQVALYEN